MEMASVAEHIVYNWINSGNFDLECLQSLMMTKIETLIKKKKSRQPDMGHYRPNITCKSVNGKEKN